MAEIASARVADCRACPRLVSHLREVREQHPDYHTAPVPAWGRRDARLLIVGLAPGMHGANRTGRPFTGDASGSFLFRALCKAGFATHSDAESAKLIDCRITNAVKCLPPANRPVAAELNQCRPWLTEELRELRGQLPRHPRCVLCLGRVAHQAVSRALVEPIAPFTHGQREQIAPRVWLVDTYHPSRQNTNTRRLTEVMLDRVMTDVKQLLSRA